MPFIDTLYSSSNSCVAWSGQLLRDCDAFSDFLHKDVAERLDDNSAQERFRQHLSSLPLTGMGVSALDAVLSAEDSEERSWAGGEALAEAFLSKQYGVTFPWNMERDKRNSAASLPGADIVGFRHDSNGSVCFALGEVKSSQEAKNPPQVMAGKSGMIHQLDNIANNLGTVCQLFKWLLPRVKGTPHEQNYNAALIAFFESGNKKIALFGVLIRDTPPHEKDLKNRGTALNSKLSDPTECMLLALHLPWSLDLLISKIREGGKS